MRVALVCDWLTTIGGAESVLLALHQMYPDAPIYTSKYTPKNIDWFKDADVRTGFMQIFPNCLRRFLSPVRQYYFSHLDLSDYDLVISVTGAEAKAVKTWKGKTRTNTHKTEQTEQAKPTSQQNITQPEGHHCTHLCYCHVPTQYYWGMYDDYIKNPGFGILNPLARLGLKLLVKPLRKKDFRSAQQPNQFITISSYAAELIKKYYKREAVIINPPANLGIISGRTKDAVSAKKDHSTRENDSVDQQNSTFGPKFSTTKHNKNAKSQAENKTNYITTSRQVNWKRLDLCVKACLRTGDELTIIGDGPEHKNLLRLANGADNIHFLPTMSQDDLGRHLAVSDAFLFPSLEPFGLAPIEAMAVGTPVIAYKAGGALDYIKPSENGLFFEKQTVASLVDAMQEFKKHNWSPEQIQKSAEKYDQPMFKKKIKELVREKVG